MDTSLVDAGVALSCGRRRSTFRIGVPSALGSAHRMNAPYQAIRCADGYITLGAATNDCSGACARGSAARSGARPGVRR